MVRESKALTEIIYVFLLMKPGSFGILGLIEAKATPS